MDQPTARSSTSSTSSGREERLTMNERKDHPAINPFDGGHRHRANRTPYHPAAAGAKTGGTTTPKTRWTAVNPNLCV